MREVDDERSSEAQQTIREADNQEAGSHREADDEGKGEADDERSGEAETE